jgi:adenosylhomocysteine nucleosidase
MKIGIIFAMIEELDAFKELITINNSYSIFDLKFYEGRVNDIECVLVESGVGKVNAARTAQILIDNMDVEYIFNVGVAGGVDASLKVKDIVIGEKLVQHDFDITAFNHEKGYIPNVGTFIDSDEYLIKIAEKCLKKAKKGVIASGDIFVTEEWMSKKINKKFNALCCEMEGASIAQVCYLSHIPFLIIRSISDVPNNNNVITYEEFVESSSKKIAKGMNKIIKKIEK